MKNILLFTASLLLTTQLSANESVKSEISHMAGGALIAGSIATVIERYYPEHRAERRKLAFKISSVAFTVFEGITIIDNGNASGQLLDIASHVAGSALGAWATDKYILTPLQTQAPTNAKYHGVSVQYSF